MGELSGCGHIFCGSTEADGVNAGAKRIIGRGNSHRGGPPGYIATPVMLLLKKMACLLRGEGTYLHGSIT